MTTSAFVGRVASVPGREARLALWVEALAGLPPAEAGRELEGVVRGAAARSEVCLVAYLPLVDLDDVAGRVGPGRMADVLEAARQGELEACLLLLESHGRRAAPAELGPPPDPVLDTLTLGHRKAAARGLRGPLLDRILHDPDPRVVAEVLRNPRLREPEVLAIASRRPCPPQVFHLLARAEVWVRRPAVRRAIALNPYAPLPLAVALLPSLTGPELDDLAGQSGLSEALRWAAGTVRGWAP